MHRNIALWLQKAADQTQYQSGQSGQLRVWYYYEPKKDGDRPKGIPTGLWYNQYGYFVSALDQSGDYHWLANSMNDSAAFQFLLTTAIGHPVGASMQRKVLRSGDNFVITLIKVKSNTYPAGFNYFAAWKED